MKKNLSDLAFFSGKPAFKEMLHVGRPNIGNREQFLELVNKILDNHWFTNKGPYVRELEKNIADFVGVKHCITMCNGTVALEIAIRACELTGEVIVPSFTFVATPHALQWQEITPVFCDIDPDTHNLDPACVEKMITPRTTGIIGVHIWGRPSDIELLVEIAKRRNLKLLYDAAHAFGCSHKGRMVGSFGDAEIFSFHATKFFNTFEGGAVVTNNDDLAAKMRLMKNFGFAGYDNVIYVGTNGKMNEISAAMGLTLLEDLDEIISVNHRNYKKYQEELRGVPGVQVIEYDESENCNFQYLVLEIDEKITHISRDLLVKILHAENIKARRYFYPGCHRMEPYRSYYPNAGLLLPETEKLVERVLCLPTGVSVQQKDIQKICQIIRLVVENGTALSKELSIAR